MDSPAHRTIVTASRRPEQAFASPRAVEVIERQRITERPASTSPEALDEVAGISVQRTASTGGSPILRGLIGRHVLLLIDGIRLNNAITRFGPNPLLNTVDPFQLEHIEVVRGPASVLYGSDAIGGVINLRTRRPRFDPHRAWDVQAEAAARFASASTAALGHAAVEGHLRQIGMRLGGTLRRFGELSGGRGTGVQPFTDYWEGSADAALAWNIGRAGTLQLSYAATRQHDAPRTDRATPLDFLSYADQLRDLVALTYDVDPDSPLLSHVHASLSYQLHRELRERSRADHNRIERGRDHVGSIGATASAQTELPYNQLSYGVDLYHDRVSSSAEHETFDTSHISSQLRGRYVDGSTYTQLGVFLIDRIAIGDKLAVDLGGRISSWFADIPADDAGGGIPAVDTADLALVGSAHARYLVGDGLNLIAGLSQGFRAPNIDDYSAQGCSGRGFDLPNANLDPERSLSAELGLKLDLWGRLNGSLFYAFSWLNDPIVRVAAPGLPPRQCGTETDGTAVLEVPTRRENAHQGQIHSLEATFSFALGRGWSLFSWLTWTHGQISTAAGLDEPMDCIPPLNGLAGLRYRDLTDGWFAELALRWATRQDRLSSGDRVDLRICPEGSSTCTGTAGYAIVSLRGGTPLLGEHLRLTMAIENIANTRYRVHGSGIDGPGLNAIASLELLVR